MEQSTKELIKHVNSALNELTDFYSVVAQAYSKASKEFRNHPDSSKQISEQLVNKTVAAAHPIINHLVTIQRIGRNQQSVCDSGIEKQLRSLKEDAEFNELALKECNEQVGECQAALSQARKECKAGSHDTAAKSIAQAEKRLAEYERKEEKLQKQIQALLHKVQTAEELAASLTAEVQKAHETNKRLQHDIKNCHSDAISLQKKMSSAKDAENEFDNCNTERQRLKMQLKQLSERLADVEADLKESISNSSASTSNEVVSTSAAGKRLLKARRSSGSH